MDQETYDAIQKRMKEVPETKNTILDSISEEEWNNTDMSLERIEVGKMKTPLVAIVLNKCHGGAAMSKEAVELGCKLSGDPQWPLGHRRDGATPRTLYLDLETPLRVDPVFVEVVQVLGERASAIAAMLVVTHIPKGTEYIIEEHGGYEEILTTEDMNWSVA